MGDPIVSDITTTNANTRRSQETQMYVTATRKDSQNSQSTQTSQSSTRTLTTPFHVSVSPAKSCDVPALVAIELPAFIEDDVSAAMLPSHRTHFERGTNPTKWPDFHRTIHERRWFIASGVHIFKATIQEPEPDFVVDDCSPKKLHHRKGKSPEKIVGMVVMIPPMRLMHPANRKDKLLNRYICPAFYRLRRILPNFIRRDGLDTEFEEKLRDFCWESRREVMGDREFYFMCLFCVSKEYQNKGIGSELLTYCTEFANKQNIPILIDSTVAGNDFYKRRGFRVVKECVMEYKGLTLSWPMMLREPGELVFSEGMIGSENAEVVLSGTV